MANPARYLVLVNLLLLGLAAYWAASTVTGAVAAVLTPAPKVHLTAPPPPLAPEPNRPAQHYAAIHKRDIFNSTRPEPPKAAPRPVKTKLQLRLWGVAIHHGGEDSYAIIEDLRKRKQDLYRVGDTVPGAAKVVSIEWDRVTLERDGSREFIDLAPEDKHRGSRRRSSRRSVRQRPRTAGGGGIEKLGATEYAIDREEVDTALENMNQLFTQIRAVPHFEGGEAVGFRVFAIRQGSIFDRIGIRNGDIVRRINDVEINDPARAMALFQELRNERGIAVELTRNRQPLTLTYNVR